MGMVSKGGEGEGEGGNGFKGWATTNTMRYTTELNNIRAKHQKKRRVRNVFQSARHIVIHS